MAEEQLEKIIQLTCQTLSQYKPKQVQVTLTLLADGNTVPFIARYRKEMTGALDEVQIREVEETFRYLQNLEKRREEIVRLIDEQGKLTPDLLKSIEKADKMQKLEDIYRPYKQKRRTKATIAKENGLEPLAQWLLQEQAKDITSKAQEFVTDDLDLEAVLQGAHEIIAESIGDQAQYREWIRQYTRKNGLIVASLKDAQKDEKGVYENYYTFEQPIAKIVPHRILALNRGEKEDVLKVNLSIDVNKIDSYLAKQLLKTEVGQASAFITEAYMDAYKRFIAPSIERELRNELTELADEQAIHVFGDNLHHLLLQPPMRGRIVLGLDPAYRTGCKLAIVDETGKVLAKDVIYPHKPASEQKRQEAGKILQRLLAKYNVEMIAIGNGTASRESEQFVAEQIKQISHTVHYVIVNEAGASVYSASELARQEFPDYQVEERSAVSIARRLQDPLAELVKIDPKSVGVGQYQHDVSQKRLGEQLDFVVETVVNRVGVDLNTASAPLLQRISGLNKTIANNIVAYRDENGIFNSRTALKKVPRLGPKAYEQAVGFLRIMGGKNIFDNTTIHPESYQHAETILRLAGLSKQDVGTQEAAVALEKVDMQAAQQETGVSVEGLQDIIQALIKPGRDMRDDIAAPILRQDVLAMSDLQVGMQLEGTVRNVVDFGAFVDIGVKQDGLVHLSKLSKKFVKYASDIVSVGDIVTVWIEQIDLAKQRVSLTMLPPSE